jgi:glycerophosphoryl diester phosphodiesterase
LYWSLAFYFFLRSHTGKTSRMLRSAFLFAYLFATVANAADTPSPQPPALSPQHPNDCVLIEAESFENCGGWVIDQQFMDLMGSPYVLAHGLGVPVTDATTRVEFPTAGKYRVWVRTRDWVAPWKAPGAPGKFQLLVDGKPLATTFGTEGAAWHWQDGGSVDVAGKVTFALHDLTGFEGRCDAILFCRDIKFVPPNDGEELAALRSELLGWSKEPADGGNFDLVVVGGGIAGTSAAVSAARLGLSVALIQDRPVLGGNGSSEVRVWPEGKTNLPPYPHVGDVVSELVRQRTKTDGNAKSADIYGDAIKLQIVRAEKNITLLLDQRVNQARASDDTIASVIAQHTHTGKRTRITGRLFLDATGDGVLGALVGADSQMTETGHMGVSNLWNVGDTTKNEFQIQCECKDTDALSMAFVKTTEPMPFPHCPWAVDLSNQPFPGRKGHDKQFNKNNPMYRLGGWFWETGFNKHPIRDIEWMRDQNLRAMYGAWDALKNVDHEYPNHRLKWAAYIAGKRESRRLLGDVVLTADDILGARPFEDASFPCTWLIDLHSPNPDFTGNQTGEEFIAQATKGQGYQYEGPFWAPYRCLYSRNIANLFMAGRDISVTHEALGAVRVMRTCGCMGEIVGMAASLCAKYDCSPRAVYAEHLDELKSLMQRGAGQAPITLASLPSRDKSATFPIQTHRGAGIARPENTLESFQWAWRHGVTPECDMRTTKDGTIVCFHDANFARVAQGIDAKTKKLGVEKLTLKEVQKLDVGSFRGSQYAGQRIPTLASVLAEMRGHPERQLYLDFKFVNLEQLATLIHKYDVEGQGIFTSTNYALIREWKKRLPESPTLCWNGGTEEELTKKMEALRKANFDGITYLQIHVHVGDLDSSEPFTPRNEFLRTLGKELKKSGIVFQVLPWECSDPRAYEKLLALGAESFATDYPEVTLAAVKQFQEQGPPSAIRQEHVDDRGR